MKNLLFARWKYANDLQNRNHELQNFISQITYFFHGCFKIEKPRYRRDDISIVCLRCGPEEVLFLKELGIARGSSEFPFFNS